MTFLQLDYDDLFGSPWQHGNMNTIGAGTQRLVVHAHSGPRDADSGPRDADSGPRDADSGPRDADSGPRDANPSHVTDTEIGCRRQIRGSAGNDPDVQITTEKRLAKKSIQIKLTSRGGCRETEPHLTQKVVCASPRIFFVEMHCVPPKTHVYSPARDESHPKFPPVSEFLGTTCHILVTLFWIIYTVFLFRGGGRGF